MTEKRNKNKLSGKIHQQSQHYEEERTPLDKYEDQKFVDDIPLEDLKIQAEQEKNKHKTQTDSQSESKYEVDPNKDKK